jgi:DNA-binding beta-propeller fold protein YncE
MFAALVAVTAASTVIGQVPGTCSPPGTPTCDPDGNPVGGVPAPVTPDPGAPGDGTPEAITVHSLTSIVPLGGGLSVKGAEGIAIDPVTGLAYIGLNGTIVSNCEGDPSVTGATTPASAALVRGPGSDQMSIVDPSASIEVAAVPTGEAPIWPTIDANRGVVYMMGSGGAGTVTVHDPTDGRALQVITVGGKPHMGGLDLSTGLMVVGNTVRSSEVIAEQNYASVIDTATDRVALAFETAPAPHGIVVDQERDLIYFSAVGNGAIVVVSAVTGHPLFASIPKDVYGADFGGNNMLARHAATRRLFQTNTQLGYTGILVADEVTLAAEQVITLGNGAIPWGMAVDEPNRLLFAALPNTNVVAVVDLDTLTHVANIPVGTCPYAIAVDPTRRLAVVTNQGSPTEDATASILSLCPIYAATGRAIAECSVLDQLRFRR